MRAAVVSEHGGRDVIRVVDDYPRPTAEKGWVVLRVGATSVNYHDIFTRRGMPGISIPLPIVIGSDVTGEIVEIGEGIDGWSIGDRVLVDPLPCAGTDWLFLGEKIDGGRAEFCAVHSTQLVGISEDVSYQLAASLPIAYGTAYRMMMTRGGLEAGEKVLILGASGGVGTSCVLLAKMAGAEVIACASSDDKLRQLGGIGADHMINYRRDDMREAVYDIVGRPRISKTGGVDLAVNYTGGKTWQETLRCVGYGGRMVTCGATAGFEEEVDCRYVWTFEHTIIGSDGWTREDIVELLTLVESGKLKPVIHGVLPLDQIREADRLLEDREAFGKVIVTP